MNDGAPVKITDADFDATVLKADRLVLVDFWATWCVPCKMIAPVIEELGKAYPDQLLIGKLDVDNNNGTAIRYGVQSIPTLILFKNGQETERIVGFMPKDRLLAKLKPHLS
jgi:thioredoxin 1